MIDELARLKSISFVEASHLIDQVKKGKSSKVIRRWLSKEIMKEVSKFRVSSPVRKKTWVSIVSGGGGPGTGKRR